MNKKLTISDFFETPTRRLTHVLNPTLCIKKLVFHNYEVKKNEKVYAFYCKPFLSHLEKLSYMDKWKY